MSSFASTLRRVTTPVASCRGIALRDDEHAVDAEADEQRVLLRLEVDVARPVLGRLEDDRVHEPDDRPLRDAVLGREVVGLVVDRLVGVVVEDRGERDVRAA